MEVKKVITFFVLFFLVFHFTLTLLFNSPYKVPFLNKYMIPLFDQNWRFFAPDPPMESRTLFFRYRKNEPDSWSTWINPGKSSQAKFDYNRFSYHGKLVHLNASICYYLNAEAFNFINNESSSFTKKKNMYRIDKKIVETTSFKLTEDYIKNWVLWKESSAIKELQMVLQINHTPSNQKHYMLFPVVKL